jgi:eukaryotic-like serine/threonine-protein kinase
LKPSSVKAEWALVYRAFDTHLDRPVAIKILRADAATSPERRRRFQQEAKAASALNHPNIVHIYAELIWAKMR